MKPQRREPGGVEADAVDETPAVPDNGAAEAPAPSDAVVAETAAEPEIEAVRRELAAVQDRYLRLAADYANYRNRTERSREAELRRERAQVLRELLDLGDNLERALRSESADLDSLRKGVELTQQQWAKALHKLGVEVLDAVGKPFDPTQHEALAMVQAEGVESGHVVEVVQPGYVMQGEVLRPARVNVAV